MKESYGEGVASHTGPESCAVDREVGSEALTGVRTGQPLSGEITSSGAPTQLVIAEGNTVSGAMRESPQGSTPSKTLCTYGNSRHGNREIPGVPCPDGGHGRSGKAKSHTPDMYAPGKSDDCIVPEKRSNKGRRNLSAETVEERRSTEGNTKQASVDRTQSRATASNGLQRVREVARRDKEARFTALLHHVTPDALRDSYMELSRQAAPGIDQITWGQYQEGLSDRLNSLHERVHKGSYRALPSRRIYIPKPDGRKRPIGIAALEDKIVQHAAGKVLATIYEEDFLGFSYGFRPGRGQHDALDALVVALMGRKVNWVLDADIQGFFDTIDHEWMLRFLEHRVADKRMLRLVRKWLRAGVSENGKWSGTEQGTPQGAVISPLLANIYLHYVLDLWVQAWRRKYARGDVIIVRYADDFVMGFQYEHEAQQFLQHLKVRLQRFGLALHPEKTRQIEFGRFAEQNRRDRGEGKPETFDFLGFTHACSKTKLNRKFCIRRKTVKKRLRATLKRIKVAMRKRMHDPIPEVGEWLRRVVLGYYRYHAIPCNIEALVAFQKELTRYWLKLLQRRSQKSRLNWRRFTPIAEHWIPRPRIMHPYPVERFYAKHPR